MNLLFIPVVAPAVGHVDDIAFVSDGEQSKTTFSFADAATPWL
jgi:hypothetical protein